jgi:hypothetical protein
VTGAEELSHLSGRDLFVASEPGNSTKLGSGSASAIARAFKVIRAAVARSMQDRLLPVTRAQMVIGIWRRSSALARLFVS